MTEHAAVIFVFFFLAEYASIVLMCIFTTILFLGGYLIDFDYPYYLYYLFYSDNSEYSLLRESTLDSSSLNGLLTSLVLGLKSSIMVFIFI